jgi:hypothetical protein
MDSERRRALKQEGKRRVDENSARVRRELHERNAYPLSDPKWAKNVLEEYEINKQYRQNTKQVVGEADVLRHATIRPLGFNFEQGFMPHEGWYVQCLTCRDLVPTKAEAALSCKCGAVSLDPMDKRANLPPVQKYQVAEVVGRGSHRPKSWWKFW